MMMMMMMMMRTSLSSAKEIIEKQFVTFEFFLVNDGGQRNGSSGR